MGVSRHPFNGDYTRISERVLCMRSYCLLVSNHHSMDTSSVEKTAFFVEINGIFVSKQYDTFIALILRYDHPDKFSPIPCF